MSERYWGSELKTCQEFIEVYERIREESEYYHTFSRAFEFLCFLAEKKGMLPDLLDHCKNRGNRGYPANRFRFSS